MSSGLPAGTSAQKIDLRKYLLVLRRRKWWGIIPTVIIALVFAVISLAMPYKYRSSCVIRASKGNIVSMLGGQRTKTRTALAIVDEEMKRYDRVMRALADTSLMRDIQARASNDPEALGELEEKLYSKVVRNFSINSRGNVLIQVSYLGSTPENAFTVLDRMVTTFIEMALQRERTDARRARELAQQNLDRARRDLETLEAQLVTFSEDHPDVYGDGVGGKRTELADVIKQLDTMDQDLAAMRRKLDNYAAKLEELPAKVISKIETAPNPAATILRNRLAALKTDLAIKLKTFTELHPSIINIKNEIEATQEQLAEAETHAGEEQITLVDNLIRSELESKKIELEADLDYKLEQRRTLQLTKQRLEEEAHALPGLQRQLTRLRRDQEAAAARYEREASNFESVEREFNIQMEGLMAFNVVAPPRRPRDRDIRHIMRMAVMGFFVAMAAGVGAIAGTEFLDQSFSDVEAARDFLRLPSLGVIPLIETPGDRRGQLIRTILIAATGVMVITAMVLAGLFVPPVRQLLRDLWLVIQDLVKDIA
jgi:polysaccharide biosynthesis transport protein